jgi:hypothetical protein
MDTLARLHFNYVVLDELHKKNLGPKSEVDKAISAYNKCLNREFDLLEIIMEEGLPIPDDWLKPQGKR